MHLIPFEKVIFGIELDRESSTRECGVVVDWFGGKYMEGAISIQCVDVC